eukprot:COSAG01_NODE_1206_length_11242_cov_29.405905_12_plen_89_part_00
MYNNWCNGQVCPSYESSQNLVQTVCIEDKISGLKGRYGGYVSGSIVVLMVWCCDVMVKITLLFAYVPEQSAVASSLLKNRPRLRIIGD